jgi:hypothetical protein
VHGRAYGKAGGAAGPLTGPLTEAEVKWLEAVTRLIRRAAEYEAKVPSLLQITMADLPPLSDKWPSPLCAPDRSDQGQRPWLLIEGLFVAVQPIRKPATGPQHSREL